MRSAGEYSESLRVPVPSALSTRSNPPPAQCPIRAGGAPAAITVAADKDRSRQVRTRMVGLLSRRVGFCHSVGTLSVALGRATEAAAAGLLVAAIVLSQLVTGVYFGLQQPMPPILESLCRVAF